ncbi:hypothetical protein KGQ34_02140 [Patescibacteria group bacterium]|nr:hypothetical protein [Patescibacteria group bacterium]
MAIKDLIYGSDVDMVAEQELFRKASEIKTLLETERGRKALSGIFTKDDKFLELFLGESTRTDLTFTNAVEELGGRLHPRLWKFSSMAKGEPMSSLTHFCEGVRYQGLIMRHDGEEAEALMREALATRNKKNYQIRFINAGMGNKEHPLQKLKDTFTIQELFSNELLHGPQTNNPLRILFCGDVAYSRTIHSLLAVGGIAQYGAKIWMTSPEDNQLPDSIRQALLKHRVEFSELHVPLKDAIESAQPHILYLSRFQFNLRKEWGGRSQEEKNKYEAWYANMVGVTQEVLNIAPPFMKILHPLPQGPELPKRVEDNSRAAYNQQQGNGVPIAMALLIMMFAPNTDLHLLHQDKHVVTVHARTDGGTFSMPSEIGNISRLCICQGGCGNHTGQCTAVESKISGTWGFVSENDFQSITGKGKVFCPQCRPH